jgi:hypothetical protein
MHAIGQTLQSKQVLFVTFANLATHVCRLTRKQADMIDQNNNTYHSCSCCTLLIASLIRLSWLKNYLTKIFHSTSLRQDMQDLQNNLGRKQTNPLHSFKDRIHPHLKKAVSTFKQICHLM